MHCGIEPNGYVGFALVSKMEHLGISGAQLGELADISYEHVRKLISGKALPSRFLSEKLSSVLKIRPSLFCNYVQQDRMRHKYKRTFWHSQGRNPDLDPFYVVWEFLSADRRKELLALATAMLHFKKRNS